MDAACLNHWVKFDTMSLVPDQLLIKEQIQRVHASDLERLQLVNGNDPKQWLVTVDDRGIYSQFPYNATSLCSTWRDKL